MHTLGDFNINILCHHVCLRVHILAQKLYSNVTYHKWLLFNSEIIVGDEELSWDMEDIHVGDDVVIRPLHERAQAMLVELDGGDIGVVVTRHHDDIGYYLGVYLSNTEGLSSDSEGLLGNSVGSCRYDITVMML